MRGRVVAFVSLVAVFAVGHASHHLATHPSFPQNTHTTASCRTSAHEVVFDRESLSDLTADAGHDPSYPHASLCARVLSTPRLRCVIATASTRCRLHRAKVTPRGRCETSDDCETCVMREIGQGLRYRGTDDEDQDEGNATEDDNAHDDDADDCSDRKPGLPKHSEASGAERKPLLRFQKASSAFGADQNFPKIHRAMEWQIYLQELESVESVCRDFETGWRAERTSRVLQKVLTQSERAAEENQKLHKDAAESAALVSRKVDAAKILADASFARLTSIELVSRTITADLLESAKQSREFQLAHQNALREARVGLEGIARLAASSVRGVRIVSRKVQSGLDVLVEIRDGFFEMRRTLVTAVHDIDAMLLQHVSHEKSRNESGWFWGWKTNAPSETLAWFSLRIAWRVTRVTSSFFANSAVFLAQCLTPKAQLCVVLCLGFRLRLFVKSYRSRQLVAVEKTRDEKNEAATKGRHSELLAEMRRELYLLRKETIEAGLFEPRCCSFVFRREKGKIMERRQDTKQTREDETKPLKPEKINASKPSTRTGARVRSASAKAKAAH